MFLVRESKEQLTVVFSRWYAR